MHDVTQSINDAVTVLRRGGVIAYPTEAVYGLGCDPFNYNAVTQLLALKKRSFEKGFILIASTWQQLVPLTQPISYKALTRVFHSWPGPFTWVFPASFKAPSWIQRKHHHTIAIRVTDHPIAKLLCHQFGRPIVSTSANQEGEHPIRNVRMLCMIFGNQIDRILEGPIGPSRRPTEIRDAITGEVLRAG
ncbi:L-threonylcarbamoyladenylate synthase [Coxiella endosymbiont of Amblyomma nuttalli]|uniref:L-threonylcarbamoyladenylate synthase n=1 Tax=Coxiella endosymbiont of Amblyomma nuttalli TaxID=2749996 RepID=UPI001BAB7557|nr:L-threonylcarbamoyladenylate synthase [Coxiella endosymbiont of Amblyomma nuttalli]